MPAKPLTLPDQPPVADQLLAWYDRHARDLPWRVREGAADPYCVWVSEVMLQQTTVAAVRPRFKAWIARWPDVASLAAADEADVMAAWAGLGYYARARSLLRAVRAIVSDHGGRLPEDEAALRALPGFGDYTAAAVAAIAFGRRAVVVDANVARVVARLLAFEVAAPPVVRAATDAITPEARAGDFAQAMMDLGATICTPRGPRCLLCPLRSDCAGFASGRPEAFPARKAKRAKPQRFGTVFWLERTRTEANLATVRPAPVEGRPSRDGEGRPSTSSGRTGEETSAYRQVLLVRRPDTGLLGGMRALPTGPWGDAPPGLVDAPVAADWTMLPGTITHSFTHFDLQLALAVARPRAHGAADGEWWPVDDLAGAGLPTVFGNAVRAIQDAIRSGA